MSLIPERTPLAELLAKMAPDFHSFDLIKSYAAIQIVARLVRTKGWKFPHAAFKNERNAEWISDQLDINWSPTFLNAQNFSTEFQQIYQAFEPLTLREFLRMMLPDFITQLTRTFQILDAWQIDVENKCLALILAKKEWLRESGKNFPIETYEKRVRACFDDEQWQKLAYAVNCYEFSYKNKVLKPANDAHKVFLQYNCPPEYQIALYGEVRERLVKAWEGKNTKWQKYISDGAHYIRKINGHNPKIDALGMDDAINRAAESIGKIQKPTDFLEAVLVNEKNDDSKIENDFVYSRFVERLAPDDDILVLNPSVDFLCQYPQELLGRTTFCVLNQPMAWVLEHQFSAKFITISDFIDYCFSGRPAEPPRYSKILIFSRGLSDKDLDRAIFGAAMELKEKGHFFAVLPSYFITQEYFPEHLFGVAFSIQKIDLLPQNSFSSAPRKKVLIQCGDAPSETIEIADYEFFKGIDNKKYLKRIFELPVILDADAVYTAKSIYTLYREKLQNAPTEYRGHPYSYEFTNEIQFWYTIANSPRTKGPKVEAYTCYFPTEKQKKRRLLSRGKKIEGSYASVSKLNSVDEIETWCEMTLPYKERIREGVLEAFKKNKKLLYSGRVTLKTIWYLQLDLKKIKTSPTIDAEKDMFSSSVGKLFLYEDVGKYEEEMGKYCEGKTEAEQTQCWNILSNILDYAVKEGYCKFNQIEGIALTFREKRDRSLENVRAALVKKTFILEEEKRLLNFLHEKIATDSEYLCVLIRFFTGLEPNIVSALTWGDIHRISNTEAYQLWIYQQYKNNGEELVPLESGEDYRRIPISETLYAALINRREDIENRFGLSKKQLENAQIIASDKQFREENASIITPRKINELSRKAVKAIGIQEIVVDLPDDEYGTKETNLTKYRGDIFRSNFRYRANILCGFTESEICYILGNRQSTPFGKNYCDYLNTFSQLGLYCKLRRWDVALRSYIQELPQMQKVTVPRILPLECDGTKVNAVLEMSLDEESREITVEINSSHGFSVQVDMFFDDRVKSYSDERNDYSGKADS